MTLTYHSNPALKDEAIEAAKRHAEMDMLRAGTYGEENGAFHGCSVGCDAYEITGQILDDDWHKVTAEYYGFPEWLERLRDAIFEGLPDNERVDWHLRLKEAVPVGADVEPVRHQLAIRRLTRLIEAQTKALKTANDDIKVIVEKVLAALQQARSCHEAEISQDYYTVDWSAVWSAAESAESAARSAEESAVWSAESAARSAVWSAAESARSAARSAESAARSAARSAAESAVWSAAESAESAAESAESAVWSAARSAAESAVWSAAQSAAESAVWSAESAVWSAAWRLETNDLIELLGRCHE